MAVLDELALVFHEVGASHPRAGLPLLVRAEDSSGELELGVLPLDGQHPGSVLLGFTALLTVVAVVLTRRGLRGAAETFWLVVAGMLTIDLLAADSAGLAGLDALSWLGLIVMPYFLVKPSKISW